MFNIFIRQPYKTLLGICILSLVMHWQFLNRDLVGIHVWRQTQTQTVINNFTEDGLNIFEPKRNDHAHTDRIQRMEFPVMQWFFAVAKKNISSHIAVSRILSLIIGFFSIAGIYRLGQIVFKNTFMALTAAFALCFSPVFYYYTINPLPDNFALFAAIWSLVFYCRYVESGKFTSLVVSTALLCLATLSKLPYILFGSIVIAHIISEGRQGHYREIIKTIATYIIMLLPALAWYLTVIPEWKGNNVTKGLFETSTYTLESIWHTFQGTITSTLPELLLNFGAVLFFIYGLYLIIKTKWKKNTYIYSFFILSVSLCAYFIFEINMIELVHDYYLMPFLPVLFLVAAYGAGKFYNMRIAVIRPLIVLLFISLPVFAALRINGRWDTERPGFNSVYYEHKDELRKLIPDDAKCVVGNDISHYILLYYLDRKGWVFDTDQLYDYDLRFYIFEGAEYLLSDSEASELPAIQQMIESKVFEKDNLKVYKLKNKSAI